MDFETASVPGLDPRPPGGRKPCLPAIPYARATPPLREWPVLHFGMEVGHENQGKFFYFMNSMG